MPLSDIVGMFGSTKPPTAVANRFAQPIMNSGRRLAVNTLNSLRTDIPNAFNTYLAGQGKQEELAGQQEHILNTLLNRRMADDPMQNLRDVFSTAFAQIDPNILNRLSANDVNRNRLNLMVAGVNPGAARSTSEDLRDARVSSGRYYDLARNVYNVVPTLFNSAHTQGLANDQVAAGFVPGISAAYEAVSGRPMQGVLNRIAAARAAQGIETQGIENQMRGTQGYKTNTNFADKFSKALAADEKAVMDIAQMALSLYTGGLAGGGGGGGIGGMLGKMFGSGGGQPGGTPSFGSQYPGYGGQMYQSVPNPTGTGGWSVPLQPYQ